MILYTFYPLSNIIYNINKYKYNYKQQTIATNFFRKQKVLQLQCYKYILVRLFDPTNGYVLDLRLIAR